MSQGSHRIVTGFMPLLDCAALVAAAECGFAAHEGLDLRLVRDTSWANIRDRLLVGQFQAAHMLGPMVLASSLGVGHLKVPLVAPVALGAGGNTVAVSTELAEELRVAGGGDDFDPARMGAALRKVVGERARSRRPPLTLAHVYPFSCHNYLLRHWLAASGIDPDVDVQLLVIPPPLLADALRAGQIDGFCAGEPWGSVSVATGVGALITTGMRIWPHGPEKVLAVRADWAAAEPQAVAAFVRAIVRAAHWCDDADNRPELAKLLSGPRYVGVPPTLLLDALEGLLTRRPGCEAEPAGTVIEFAAGDATVPWPEHARWHYRQMVRWQQLAHSADAEATAAHCFRSDLYAQALAHGSAPRRTRDDALFDGTLVAAAHGDGA